MAMDQLAAVAIRNLVKMSICAVAVYCQQMQVSMLAVSKWYL